MFKETAYHRYLWYVLRHKWYVALECWKEGLYWAALVHDWSKFLPDEFIPYARHFHGPQAKENLSAEKGKSGYKKPVKTNDSSFDQAWLRHTRRNPHHPEYWVMGRVGEEATPFPMPEKYVREMVCDWRGAGRAQNNPVPTHEWYLSNLDRLLLHPQTQALIEDTLDVFRTVIGTAENTAKGGETVRVLTAASGFNRVEVDFQVAPSFTVESGDLVCLHNSNKEVRPFIRYKYDKPKMITRLMSSAIRKVGIFNIDYAALLIDQTENKEI